MGSKAICGVGVLLMGGFLGEVAAIATAGKEPDEADTMYDSTEEPDIGFFVMYGGLCEKRRDCLEQ